jgi:3-dehydroquinate synthase
MYKRDSFFIDSALGSYSVNFERFEFRDSEFLESDVILIDKKFGDIKLIPESDQVIRINSGEEAKDIFEVGRVTSLLADLGVNRSSKIIAIGGGSIQDLATFVASTYMRGIKWEFYPTTLQAMADSCIGGKSAINVGIYKNLIGNFYPPRKVIIDASLIGTLSTEDITCGLVEALKIAFATGGCTASTIAEVINSNESLESISYENYELIVDLSLKSKKYFVEKDEFDENLRKNLNFGHTYAHAIEASSNFKVHHGLAVGLGILASFVHRGNDVILPEEEVIILAIRKLLTPFKDSLNGSIGSINQSDFSRFIQLDKKVSNNNLNFIHAKNGKLKVVSLPKNEATLQSAYDSVLEALNAI